MRPRPPSRREGGVAREPSGKRPGGATGAASVRLGSFPSGATARAPAAPRPCDGGSGCRWPTASTPPIKRFVPCLTKTIESPGLDYQGDELQARTFDAVGLSRLPLASLA